MKLAIRGHDLGKKGEFDLVEKLSEFGFDGVQLVPYKTYSDIPQSPEISDDRANEISTDLKNANKSVVMLGAYFNPVHSKVEKVENGIFDFSGFAGDDVKEIRFEALTEDVLQLMDDLCGSMKFDTWYRAEE